MGFSRQEYWSGLPFPSPSSMHILNTPLYKVGLLWYLSWQRIQLQCRRPQFDFWVGKIRWRRDRLPTPVFLSFSCGSAGKEPAWSVGDLGSVPGLGRSREKGKATHSSSLTWRIPWTSRKESDTTERLSLSFFFWADSSNLETHYLW